jgi:very-short-patch-repair endonuclease
MNPKEWKRNFAIDIAFPNEKIGIEINGNQHYQSNGQLKKYYQERHDILEGFGWKIFEIPYLMVWNEDFKSDILK